MVNLNPKLHDSIYTQPTTAKLKNENPFEVVLQKYCGVIFTLPFRNYSSLIFVRRKPIDKVSILIELWQINHIDNQDYIEHNHPATAVADAAQHLAGKKYFCKLDCSQAYHCLQMRNRSYYCRSTSGHAFLRANVLRKAWTDHFQRSTILSELTSILHWRPTDALKTFFS